jgi:hypothetical protein
MTELNRGLQQTPSRSRKDVVASRKPRATAGIARGDRLFKD